MGLHFPSKSARTMAVHGLVVSPELSRRSGMTLRAAITYQARPAAAAFAAAANSSNIPRRFLRISPSVSPRRYFRDDFPASQIGRASCRERVEMLVGGGDLNR